MVRRTGPTNVHLQELIKTLKKAALDSETPLWKRLADELEAPSRRRRMVNLYKISKYAQDNEIIVVPGKVLATGDVTKKLAVAAWAFSGSAKEKIQKAKGEAFSIGELLKRNPNVQNIRIMG
ncbi:MAG: 50S ribosomal protein L18e [Candidatus Woesearchaeota archaeon]|nr:50S ribosomal protein L18e [Candidatus Woesearchaeota archaeon]